MEMSKINIKFEEFEKIKFETGRKIEYIIEKDGISYCILVNLKKTQIKL